MKVTVEYNPLLSYVTHSNRTPILQLLSLYNDSEERMEEVTVTISWDHSIVETWQEKGINLEPNQTLRLNFKHHPLKINGAELVAMTEALPTQFMVEVRNEQEILHEQSFEMNVLAYNQWLGSNYHPALLASFVTPNHPIVDKIAQKASQILKGWNLALTGYQTEDKNDVIAQMKAIYLAIQQEKINYISAMPNFETFGQRIRFVEDVITNRLANCLEIAILYSACLEYIGLHPLVIVLNGHAFAGCWLEDYTFPNSIEDDDTALTKRLARGIKTIELVETTMLTGDAEYEMAVKTAEERIVSDHDFDYLVDVVKARTLGIRPLPQKIDLLSSLENSSPTQSREGTPDIAASQPTNLENSDNIEIITGQKRSRLQVWESKLLNLTLRNNLLNFRPTRQSISILEGDINALEDYLSSGKEFSLLPCPSQIEQEKRREKEYSYHRNLREDYQEYMNMEMKSGRIITLLSEEDLDIAIKNVYYSARTELEENGANTLFLAMGFLKWYETDLSKQARYAPILLYPIELIRKSSIKGYVIRYRDEEIQVNTTLLEKLRMELNLEFPSLSTLPEDEQGVDIRKILNTVRTAVLHKKGWDVIPVSYIGLFSFNQFVMWNDIHNRGEELMSNPIISSLMQGKLELESPEIIASEEIDTSDMFSKNAILMDADSSQLMAVYSAAKGSSFVLHGPPGTGKSQTITNIIASALYNNKSVLFVAEKMAALSVVQARLEKVGLGDFALELHSNKAKKGEVLAKIERVLDRKTKGEIKKIQEERQKLAETRDAIRLHSEELHQVGSNGYSLYEMISRYEAEPVQRIVPVGNLAKKVSKDMVQQIRHQIDRWLPLLEDVSPVPQNRLQEIGNANLSFKQREELKEKIEVLLKDYDTLIHRLTENRIVGKGDSFVVIEGFSALYSQLIQASTVLWYYMENWKREEMESDLEQMIAKGKANQSLYQQITQEFQPNILELDGNQLLLNWNFESQKWVLTKWLGQSKLRKQIASYARNPETIQKETIRQKLERIVEYQRQSTEIAQFMNGRAMKLQGLWQGNATDWQQLEQAVIQTKHILQTLKQLYQLSPNHNWQGWLTQKKENWLVFKQNEASAAYEWYRLVQLIKNRQTEVFALAGADKEIRNRPIEEVRERWQGVIDGYAGLDVWLSYIALRHELQENGLTDLITQIEQGEIAANEGKAIWTKSLMYYGIVEILEQKKELTNFNYHNFENLLEQYRKELKLVTEMTRLELIEKLADNIPKPVGDINVNSEMGILKKAIKNGGRNVSLRKLFDMTPNVLRKIAPCMLMSPISIAQYISPSFPKFDLVIFDEASQVNTHAAVGAIARGNQLIVVGDPNQLPPTSFFKGNFEEEDMEFEEADQESILDECQSILFPELHLKWHYRSSHESLIAFSNSQYYENKLYTFPSYNDLESKVRFVEVEGFYDRSGSKQNVAEAKAIIAEIKHRLEKEELRKESLGIVTFSSVQQKLIQTELEKLFVENPELEEYAQAMQEEIFVKNLENVQGDERDVILFSVGYGPDQKGKVTMNFGPLNHAQGWKRLNVVVSRSRNEMVVFSTLKPEQIDLSRTDALGVIGLKRFLEFARNKNSLMVDVQNSQSKKDELLEVIAQEIEKLGYKVLRQVGKSNYRIDIGVVSKNSDNEYMAAIILDGHQYHQTPTVRDRTVVQPSMLKRLQWNVISIWTLEWFKNKEAVMQRVHKELQEIEEKQKLSGQDQKVAMSTNLQSNSIAKPKPEETVIEFVRPKAQEIAVYHAFPLPEGQYAKEAFYDPIAKRLITQLMKDVIVFEAPIVEEDLFRRILAVWGITQLSGKAQEVLKAAVQNTDSYYVTEKEQGVYWKNREQYEQGAIARRFQEDKRKFAWISLAEIEATILAVLEEQVSLDSKNLCKEVFRFHGYSNLGEESQAMVEYGVNSLVAKGELAKEDDKFVKK